MELKQRNWMAKHFGNLLLIVPYGIETRSVPSGRGWN